MLAVSLFWIFHTVGARPGVEKPSNFAKSGRERVKVLLNSWFESCGVYRILSNFLRILVPVEEKPNDSEWLMNNDHRCCQKRQRLETEAIQ